jgi:hypothetical protein
MQIPYFSDPSKMHELQTGDNIYYGYSCLEAFGRVLEIHQDGVLCCVNEMGCGFHFYNQKIRNINGLRYLTKEEVIKLLVDEYDTTVTYFYIPPSMRGDELEPIQNPTLLFNFPQKDCPVEFQQVIEDNFWECYCDDKNNEL